MTSPIEPRTASLYHASRAPAVEPGVAAAIVAAAMASYLAVMAVVQPRLSFVIAQLALAAVAAIAAAIAASPGGARGVVGALGLRGARPRFFAAAIAIGATTWYVNAWLVDWLVARLGLPQAEIHHLKGLVERPPLPLGLAMFALLPAVCEEIVFRGVLARSLGRRHSLIAAAAISAAVFAAYHLSLIQALPTLTLGLLLAVIAIRADSIAPTMLAHAINNALAIAMSRGELPAAAGWLDRHPIAALAGCTAATAGGIVMAARRERDLPMA